MEFNGKASAVQNLVNYDAEDALFSPVTIVHSMHELI